MPFTTSCDGAKTCLTATVICAAPAVLAGGKVPIPGTKVVEITPDGLLEGLVDTVAGTVVLVGVALLGDGDVVVGVRADTDADGWELRLVMVSE